MTYSKWPEDLMEIVAVDETSSGLGIAGYAAIVFEVCSSPAFARPKLIFS